MKPEKPEPNQNTVDIVRAGVQTEFWKIISSYLANELADLSYAIIKKEWRGKPLQESELDGLRKNLEFVEWHIKLPEKIVSSVEQEKDLPNYDPYPNTDDA